MWTASANKDGHRLVLDEKGKEIANCGRHKLSKKLAEQVAALPEIKKLVDKATYHHIDGDEVAVYLPSDVYQKIVKALA